MRVFICTCQCVRASVCARSNSLHRENDSSTNPLRALPFFFCRRSADFEDFTGLKIPPTSPPTHHQRDHIIVKAVLPTTNERENLDYSACVRADCECVCSRVIAPIIRTPRKSVCDENFSRIHTSLRVCVLASVCARPSYSCMRV